MSLKVDFLESIDMSETQHVLNYLTLASNVRFIPDLLTEHFIEGEIVPWITRRIYYANVIIN